MLAFIQYVLKGNAYNLNSSARDPSLTERFMKLQTATYANKNREYIVC